MTPSLLPVLLCLGAASQPPPPHLLIWHASLFPSTDTKIGEAHDLPVTLTGWASLTRARVHHEGKSIRLDAQLNLLEEGTYVYVKVPRAQVLTGTGDWTVVMQPDASLPLLGGDENGVILAFPLGMGGPVERATLSNKTQRPVPAARGPLERCWVHTMRAQKSFTAETWNSGLAAWTVHTSSTARDGWRTVWAQAEGVVVHGFAAPADVDCGGRQVGVAGLGSVWPEFWDGHVAASEAELPRGTELFAGPGNAERVVVLRAPTLAYWTEDNAWRLENVPSRGGHISLEGLHAKPGTVVPPAHGGGHAVGGKREVFKDWPRLRPSP